MILQNGLQNETANLVPSSGAPRSMKMGTIASPWHYDAATYHTFSIG
jgi:hypothetical protein